MSVSLPSLLSVGEGAGTVEVCVSLSVMEMKETEREFTVTLNNQDDTGIHVKVSDELSGMCFVYSNGRL